MFVLHYSWQDGNGTQYGGKLVATLEEANAALEELKVDFECVDESTRDEISFSAKIENIELGGDFYGEFLRGYSLQVR